MNTYKSKMATIDNATKSNLFRLVSIEVSVLGLEVIGLGSEFEPYSSSNGLYNFQFKIWLPERQWHHLQMILLCWGDRYGHLETLNIKIRPLFQILLTQ